VAVATAQRQSENREKKTPAKHAEPIKMIYASLHEFFRGNCFADYTNQPDCLKGYLMRPNQLSLSLVTGLLTLLISATACAGVRTVTSHGKSYVTLPNLAATYGMTVSGPTGKRIRLQNKWNKIEFQTDSRNVWINGVLVALNDPTRKIGWNWAIDTTDFNKTIEPAVRPQEFLKNAGTRTVVLDPGHGGDDKGTSSPRNVQEKLVVLDIAKRVKAKLEARGINVELTRESDRALDLSARCRKAAALKADLFVSIHANSAGKNRDVRGAETFVLALPGRYSSNSYGSGKAPTSIYNGNRYDIANMALAYRLQQNLIKATGQEDRGVKRARFQVLREAPCPAALVETAFLSNPKDEAITIDPAGRDRMARGIADGIAAYLSDVKRAKQ
jgi:N-acetylmuramoyl-L-alanine amidase